MNKPRVVLDTNVVISALLFEGAANQLSLLWKSQRFLFLASKDIVSEYLKVLAYPKFSLTKNEIEALLEAELLPHITPLNVKKVERVIREDPDDDKFLACAKQGRAHYLVTGDKHLLSLNSYGKTKIISIAEFLGRVSQ